MIELTDLVPSVVSGLVAAGASWGALSVKLRWMRADIDRLRENMHGPQNPHSVRSVLQAHENRLTILETLEERKA